LEPLSTDSVDFVRQGAFIALAMVLVQTSRAQEPRVEKMRKLFADKIADKHEDIMAKFGACIASGIIDCGGRNCTISPQSGAGHKNTTAIVGLALFTQFWYWHPLAHFLSLSFTPTAIIGLTKDLKMPVFKFKSNAKPSLFAYPPETKPPTAKAAPKLKSAELSITKKAKIRAQQKEKTKSSLGASDLGASEGGDKMDIDSTKKDEQSQQQTAEKPSGDTMETDKSTEKEEVVPQKEKVKEKKRGRTRI